MFVQSPSKDDLVPLAGLKDLVRVIYVPVVAGGDDDQPSQLYAAQCESWEVPRNTDCKGQT